MVSSTTKCVRELKNLIISVIKLGADQNSKVLTFITMRLASKEKLSDMKQSSSIFFFADRRDELALRKVNKKFLRKLMDLPVSPDLMNFLSLKCREKSEMTIEELVHGGTLMIDKNYKLKIVS